MKKRLFVAAAGAALTAGLVGGTGFAAPSGRNGTQTNISSHDPRDAAHAIHCANLQLDIVQLGLKAASASNAHQARAIARHAAQLRQQFLRQCT